MAVTHDRSALYRATCTGIDAIIVRVECADIVPNFVRGNDDVPVSRIGLR